MPICPAEVGEGKVRPAQIGAAKLSPAQDQFGGNDAVEIGLAKVGTG